MNGKLTYNFNKLLPRHQGGYIAGCVLALIVLVIIIGFIFNNTVTTGYFSIQSEILFQLGFGVVPVALWLLVFLITLYRTKSFLNTQNLAIWSAMLVAVIAAISLLSISHPGFDSSLRMFTLDGEVSLGGRIGSLITNDNSILAIVMTIVLSLCCISILFPKPSYYGISKLVLVSWKITQISSIYLYKGFATKAKLIKLLFGQIYSSISISKPKDMFPEMLTGSISNSSESIKSQMDLMEDIQADSDEQPGALIAQGIESPSVIADEPAINMQTSGNLVDEQGGKVNLLWNEEVGNENELEQALLVKGLPILDKWDKLWVLPKRTIMVNTPTETVSPAEMAETSKKIQQTLNDYGVEVEVKMTRPGPTVTMYGIEPGWIRRYKQENVTDASGKPILDESGKIVRKKVESKTRVKVDTIMQREKDLALALQTSSIRIESPVLGTSLVGIEVPNSNPSLVTIRSVMDDNNFRKLSKTGGLPIALGKSTGGDNVVLDLAKMPHLLVAGATGSGKSVCLNTIVSCLISENSPSQLRLLLIDPKRVELTPFNGIPHLLTPVIVETGQVVPLLKALINEMLKRYKHMEQSGVRNISAYNSKSKEKMPYLVVVIDELADLMMNSSVEAEQSLCRLAQLGRATGIHLIIATQRPSVDVLTGLIKANFPSRIAFGVTSQIDSRTILDSIGAEKLLGRGDMLYQPIDASRARRVQGVFISDAEINQLVKYWRNTTWPPLPDMALDIIEDSAEFDNDSSKPGGDELMGKAVALANTERKLSTSFLQRRLRIGYPRAARLMDELEEQGIVGPSDGSKSRDVIIR